MQNMTRPNTARLPWRLSGKESACPYRRGRLEPWVGEIPLEEGMAAHSRILAWRIPWTEEPGGLQSMGSQKLHVTEWLKDNAIIVFTLTLWAVRVLVAQPCLTHCDPTDCSPPGSSARGIFQARTLEWAAISSSRGSSWPREELYYSQLRHEDTDGHTTELAKLLGFYFIFNFFIFNWRLIALQRCAGFCHPSAGISHRHAYAPSS